MKLAKIESGPREEGKKEGRKESERKRVLWHSRMSIRCKKSYSVTGRPAEWEEEEEEGRLGRARNAH